ncbi:MAG: HEAT repeat domain-containing protein [Candidatus Omnitrophica bacterium]|nr:HEAT repeat domain-containing protein [Candidatus Omnitrophota bacterium]
MKKTIVLIGIAALIISSTFFVLSSCLAAELSSLEIKRIEERIEKIKSRARGIQRRGYKELEEIGPVTAPYLIEVLKDKSVNSESRTLVCDLLGKLKAKEAVPVLIYTLKKKSHTVRAAACKALGKIANPAALDPLLEMLDDEKANVRESAIYALINFDNDIIPLAVVELMEDEAEHVRIAAVTLFDDKLDPRTAEPIREALEKDKSVSVRQIAARALGGLRDRGAVDILMEAITEDRGQGVREECATSLGDIGEARAIPALIEALKDDYKEIQLKALRSLKELTGKHFGRDYDEWSTWYESQHKKDDMIKHEFIDIKTRK